MTRPLAFAAAALALLAGACLLGGSAAAEQSGGGGVVVSFDGSISPQRIPRDRSVPVSVALRGHVESVDGSLPPQLRRLEIAFGSRGGLDTAGLAVCPRSRLRDANRDQALDRCRDALVGRGEVEAEVPLDPDRPLLAHAAALAFNGTFRGRPAVWVHAYSASPPVSFVLPFFISRRRSGPYGLSLHSPVRRALGRWPRLRSFEISLGRRYRVGDAQHSYLNARCPLPPGFNALGILPLARATYSFMPKPTLTTTILRGCRVRR